MGIAWGCEAVGCGRRRSVSSKWHGHHARAPCLIQTDARAGGLRHCSFHVATASTLSLAAMAFGFEASAFGTFRGLGGLAHLRHTLGLDEERAELGEAFALVALLRSEVVGLDQQLAGVGDIVRAERGEAVLRAGGDGQCVDAEAERALGGSLVDVLAAGAGAGGEGEVEHGFGDEDAWGEFEAGGCGKGVGHV